MEDNFEQNKSEVLELKKKANLDEERMKDLQKQAIEAGKTKQNVVKALTVAAGAAPLLFGLAGALAGGSTGVVPLLQQTGTVMGALGQVVPVVAKAAEIGMILLENQVAADFFG